VFFSGAEAEEHEELEPDRGWDRGRGRIGPRQRRRKRKRKI